MNIPLPRCVLIRNQDGIDVVCEVLHFPIIDREALMPLMHVKAKKGRPFNGLREIITPVSQLRFAPKEQTS